MHDGAEGDTRESVDLLRVIAERRSELTGIVLVFVKELDVQAEDRAERERAQLGRKLSGGRQQLVAQADGDHGKNSDDEKVERITITIVPPLVRASLRESVDTLGEDDTVRRVRRTVADSCDSSKEVLPPDVTVDVAHALEDVEHRVVILLSDLLLLLLL